MWLRKSRKEPVLSHISMKNLPESERPYERFQILGAEALSDAELLAIILKTGAKDYTALDLARDLLSECQGNLLNLYEIGYEQLLERRGIGPVAITLSPKNLHLESKKAAIKASSLRCRSSSI